jgi:hypothetical protein
VTFNTELAGNIRTVAEMIPGMHDQGNWFYVFSGDNPDRLTPEDIHVVELVAEAKENEAKGLTHKEYEPVVSCQATLCAAGWACLMSGYALEENDEDKEIYAVDKDGNATEVFKKAQELLGLDYDLANWLFCSTSDAGAIEALGELSEGKVPSAYYGNDDYCCDLCND